MALDYFYGQVGELFSFYRIPKALFLESRFQNLSTDAKTLYGILLDRMSLSAKNGWLDEQGRVFIITGKNFFKNPQAVLEYRIVPLMMSVVTIGNDLSAAALTRGLGNGKKRTSICKIGFHWKDFALMIIVTAALLVFLLF